MTLGDVVTKMTEELLEIDVLISQNRFGTKTDSEVIQSVAKIISSSIVHQFATIVERGYKERTKNR